MELFTCPSTMQNLVYICIQKHFIIHKDHSLSIYHINNKMSLNM